jgi:hypothetical protein
VTFEALDHANGEVSLGELIDAIGISGDICADALLTEMFELWSSRAVSLTPKA